MRIKQFLIYAIIYIGFVGVIVFSQQGGSYTLSIFGFSLTLPIALWVVLPVAILAILSIIHMIFNGISVYKGKRAINHDINSYHLMAKEILLGLDSNKEFKTEIFKDSNELTKALSPWHDINEASITNEELKNVVEMVRKIKNGEYEDIKKFKLPKNNPLFIKNEFNRLGFEPKYAHEILRNKTTNNDDLVKAAYKTILANEPYIEIKKYKTPQTTSEISLLVDRYVNNEFEISKEDLILLMSAKIFTEKDYLEFAKKLQKKLQPDALIVIFDRLRNENSQANEAYLYLLYEVGMIDELREQIIVNDGEEYQKFKILLFLKDNGKNVPASLIF